MLNVGLPMGAVKNALLKDGKDPKIIDLDSERSLKSQMKKKVNNVDDGPLLKDEPEYTKYFKMLNVGLPMGAVKNAVQKDGKNPGIMDLNPDKPLKSQLREVEQKKEKRKTKKKEMQKRRKVRRKKIYWNAVDDSKIGNDCIWSMVQ